jgi:hypothetical protein
MGFPRNIPGEAGLEGYVVHNERAVIRVFDFIFEGRKNAIEISLKVADIFLSCTIENRGCLM